MKTQFFGAVAALLLAGCTTMAGPSPAELSSSFDESEVAWFKTPGTNTIKGNAVLRTVGGEVRTCAGLVANLVPVSSYAEERFLKMYGPVDSGYLPADSGFSFAETDERYAELSKQTRCDSQGNFVFRDVPDGNYYVTAEVTWGIPQRYHTEIEGGMLMQTVSVDGGETKEIVLTSQ